MPGSFAPAVCTGHPRPDGEAKVTGMGSPVTKAALGSQSVGQERLPHHHMMPSERSG